MTRKALTLGIVAVAIIASLGAALGPAAADADADADPARLVVAFRDAPPQDDRLHGAPVVRVHPDARTVVVLADPAEADRIRADARVAHVTPDVPLRLLDIPNDPKYPQQWALPVVQASDAWNVTHGSDTVRVAIIDTGIDTDHEDRPAALVLGPDYGDHDGHPEDVHGHGTWVAGILAGARGNGIGTAGLANIEAYPIKVFSDTGVGYTSALDQALAHAVNAGARVITMSVGFDTDDLNVRNRVRAAADAGVLMIAAAGNEYGGTVLYPAAYPEVIAVSSVGPDLLVAEHSSTGPEVELAAPGVHIKATWRGGGYSATSGTSGAAPHVAAVAALMFSIAPGLDATMVREALALTSLDLGIPGRDPGHGYGLVQAYDALTAVFDAMPGESIASDTPLSIAEGTAVTLHVGGVPIGARGFAWDTNGDDAYDDASGIEHDWTGPDDGVHRVAMRYDSPIGPGTVSRQVTVTNAAPTITSFHGPAGGATGEALTFTAAATDPADPLTYRFEWGDGTATTTDLPTATHAWAPGTYQVRLVVDDGDGGSATTTRSVRIGDDGSFIPGSLRVRAENAAPTSAVAVSHPTRYLVDVEVVLEVGGPVDDVRIDFVIRRGNHIQTFATRTLSTDAGGIHTIPLTVPLDLTTHTRFGDHVVDARLDPGHAWHERNEANNIIITTMRHLI